MRLATLCTNRQRCCLPLHTAVRLTPAVDSQVWTCYSCYAIVESVWSKFVFVRCVTKMDRQKFEKRCAITFCVQLGESATVTYEKLVDRLVDNTRHCLDSTCNNIIIMFRAGKVASLRLGQKTRYNGWSNLQFSPLSSDECLDYTNRYDNSHQALFKSF